MEWKILCGLLAAVSAYVTFGALIFMYIEGEYHARTVKHIPLRNITRKLHDRYSGLSEADCLAIMRYTISLYDSGQLQFDGAVTHEKWDFPASMFFAATSLATIGYGNVAPVSAAGRGIFVVYGLFGIPLMFYTLAGLGDRINAFNRRFKFTLDDGPKSSRLICILRCGLTFSIGWILFIQLPAVVYTAGEGWSYPDSIYFSFVTLSTVGFGDILPDNRRQYSQVTRLTLIVWLILGLAWLSTTVTAMQDVLDNLIHSMRRKTGRRRFQRTGSSSLRHSSKRLSAHSSSGKRNIAGRRTEGALVGRSSPRSASGRSGHRTNSVRSVHPSGSPSLQADRPQLAEDVSRHPDGTDDVQMNHKDSTRSLHCECNRPSRTGSVRSGHSPSNRSVDFGSNRSIH